MIIHFDALRKVPKEDKIGFLYIQTIPNCKCDGIFLTELMADRISFYNDFTWKKISKAQQKIITKVADSMPLNYSCCFIFKLINLEWSVDQNELKRKRIKILTTLRCIIMKTNSKTSSHERTGRFARASGQWFTKVFFLYGK